MENMTPFDVVAFHFLLGMFILGYIQGMARRIFGIIALVFSLLVALELRQPLGDYLAQQWTNAPAGYSFMVGFGALFVALGVALSLGIQWAYRPSPLIPRYPALDDLLGGVLGVIEGIVLLVALLLITDPYFLSTAGHAVASGEFQPIRSLHDFLNDSLTAKFLRENVIANLLAVLGFLFPRDIIQTFSFALRTRVA
jgi:uncharacterized membrane protein required for colicin V production